MSDSNGHGSSRRFFALADAGCHPFSKDLLPKISTPVIHAPFCEQEEPAIRNNISNGWFPYI
jgi:hypothetical protein